MRLHCRAGDILHILGDLCIAFAMALYAVVILCPVHTWQRSAVKTWININGNSEGIFVEWAILDYAYPFNGNFYRIRINWPFCFFFSFSKRSIMRKEEILRRICREYLPYFTRLISVVNLFTFCLLLTCMKRIWVQCQLDNCPVYRSIVVG